MRKEDSTSSSHKFQGIKPECMLQILGTSVKSLGKLLICFEDTRKLNLEGWGGTKEGLSSWFYKYNYFIHLASFTLVRYGKVFESKEAKWIQVTRVSSRKAVQRKIHKAVSDMMKKLYSILLILTPIKKFMPFKNLCRFRSYL